MVFSTNKTDRHDITEILLKDHQTNKQTIEFLNVKKIYIDMLTEPLDVESNSFKLCRLAYYHGRSLWLIDWTVFKGVITLLKYVIKDTETALVRKTYILDQCFIVSV